MGAADDVIVKLRALGARGFKRDMDRSARSVDNLGDQAGQAARKMRSLNRQTGNARISLGPVSIKAKHAGLAFGLAALSVGKASTALIGFSEASATAIGGAGAAGGVGLTALAQGMLTVKLATSGLSEALGGNEEALAKLNPAQARFVAQLQEMQPLLDTLRASASGGLLGGAGKGLRSASKNFGVLNKIVKGTSGTLGGLAAKAGKGLGSKRAGHDLAAMGATNVRIIQSLGDATLSLASAVGNVLVEAGPLAEWLADAAKKGAHLIDVWTGNARATGRLADFFKRAKTNLAQLGSILGHTGAGIINLFGSHDVDGTKTLASLDRITARFEAWSKSPAVRRGVGQAIIDQIPNATAGIASALGKALTAAGFIAAKSFLKAFLASDVWGKAVLGGLLAKKLGVGRLAVDKLLGGKGGKGPLAALAARGASPANPLFVVDVSGGVPGTKGPIVTPPGGGGSWLKAIPGVAAVLGGGKSIGDALDKKLGGPKHRNQPHNPSNAIGDWVKKHLTLPSFASGGTMARRGPALVGERGPEVVNLNRGATVTPMGGGDTVIHNVLHLDGRVVYESYNRHRGRETARH